MVAGFYPLAEIAGAVGNDRVDVHNLTPAGAEPHGLELNSRQVDRVEDADVVLYLGDGFQPALAEAAERAGDDVDVLAALEAVDAVSGDDPHFWLDPRLMRAAVAVVEDALADADPSGADIYRRNAEDFRNRLTQLDRELEQGLRDCERRQIVTSHDAFSYLADRYDLRQEAVTGLSPEAEPDPERLEELVDLVEREGVTTVFSETLLPADVAETLAREAGVRTAVLDPIEGLSDERLAAGADYTSVMRDNLDALRKGLGCR